MHRHGPAQRNHRLEKSHRSHDLVTLDDCEFEQPEQPEDELIPSGRPHDVLDFQGEDPLSQLLHDESTRLIMRALQRLPSMQRLCIILSFYDNLPVVRISELLGISETRVSEFRRRGLRRVERYLRKFQ